MRLPDIIPNGKVIGIDTSEGMIKTAKEIESNVRQPLKNIERKKRGV